MTDDELNEAMAEVMGWSAHAETPWRCWYRDNGSFARTMSDWRPASDYNDVFEVVEQVIGGHALDVDICRAWNTGWRVDISNVPFGGPKENEVYATARGDALPRAICEAVLAAKRDE